jgi:hypothetical protein
LRVPQGFAEGCIGTLKFGDLMLQSADFREQHGHVFSLNRVCRQHPSAASPVAETAAI